MALSPEVKDARKSLAIVAREMGPPPLPVRWRADLAFDCPHFAETAHCGDHFTIRLRRAQCVHCLTDTICHELAHVYSWTPGAEYRGDHDEIWGVFYSRVYCALRGSH